jgi:hypothetical protein
MRILLKFVLDCDPDAAWLAIRSPAVMSMVAAPFAQFRSLDAGGFPEVWHPGPHAAELTSLAGLPVGDQVIDIALKRRTDGVRMMRDAGYGESGVLALITFWQHTMAVSPAEGGGTLYRDQLVFRAGLLTPLFWPVYWAFWQWRGFRLRRLTRGWRA